MVIVVSAFTFSGILMWATFLLSAVVDEGLLAQPTSGKVQVRKYVRAASREGQVAGSH